MLDGALARLPGDVRSYLRAEWIDLTDCPLCRGGGRPRGGRQAGRGSSGRSGNSRQSDD